MMWHLPSLRAVYSAALRPGRGYICKHNAGEMERQGQGAEVEVHRPCQQKKAVQTRKRIQHQKSYVKKRCAVDIFIRIILDSFRPTSFHTDIAATLCSHRSDKQWDGPLAQCDDCDKWRELTDVLLKDVPTEEGKPWFCWNVRDMTCSVKEEDWKR